MKFFLNRFATKLILFTTILILFFIASIKISALDLEAENRVITFGENYVNGVGFSRTTIHPNYDPSWTYTDWSFSLMWYGDSLVYCLDPESKIVSGHTYSESANWGYLSGPQQKEIVLTANYGYGYQGEKSNALHWATQVRIWEIAGWDVSWGSLNAKKEYDQIRQRVNDHHRRPSWHNKTLSILRNQVIDLSDPLLKDFSLTHTNTSQIEIIENKKDSLKIRVNDPLFKMETLKFQKNAAHKQGLSIVYQKPGEQTFFKAFNEDPITSSVRLEIETGHLELIKEDEAGQLYEGIVFELSRDKQTILSKHTSDARGRIQIKDLDPGTYYLREVSVVEPLILDAKWHPFTIEKNQTTKLRLVNNKAKGKIGGEKISNHQRPIEGAIFHLFNEEGEQVDTLISDSLGQFQSINLPLGKYTLKEVSVPSGFVLDEREWGFDLRYEDALTPVVYSHAIITNDYQRAHLKLHKYEDESDLFFKEYHGIALPGVGLELYAKEAVYEGDELIYEKDALVAWGLSDETGVLWFAHLPMGLYYITEPLSLPGYQSFSGKWDIELKYDSDKSHDSIVMYEMDLMNTAIYGSVELFKKSSMNNRPLKGTIFELRRSHDDFLLGTYETDLQGRIRVDGLRFAEKDGYYFKEIMAPSNHILNAKPLYFEISNQDERRSVSAFNEERLKVLPLTGYSQDSKAALRLIVLGIGLVFIQKMIFKTHTSV